MQPSALHATPLQGHAFSLADSEKYVNEYEGHVIMKKERAPRDWRGIWWAYIGHFLWGGLVGWLCAHAHFFGEIATAIVALTLAFVFHKYERSEFLDIGDNVTRDTQDFNRGLILIGLLSVIYYYFWR